MGSLGVLSLAAGFNYRPRGPVGGVNRRQESHAELRCRVDVVVFDPGYRFVLERPGPEFVLTIIGISRNPREFHQNGVVGR
jgi:hypothetical protein